MGSIHGIATVDHMELFIRVHRHTFFEATGLFKIQDRYDVTLNTQRAASHAPCARFSMLAGRRRRDETPAWKTPCTSGVEYAVYMYVLRYVLPPKISKIARSFRRKKSLYILDRASHGSTFPRVYLRVVRP